MLTILTLGFAAAPVSAQQTLTVADGTTTNNYVPVYGLWLDNYTRTQVIYPDTMLTNMTGQAIFELTFYFSSAPSTPSSWTSNFEVRLGTTSETTLSSYQTSPAALVYSGTLDGSTNLMTITFSSPYVYTGGNLLLEIASTTTGGYSGAYFYGISSTGSSLSGYSSSGPNSVSPTQRDFIPKTTFSYGSSNCGSTGEVVVSNITPYNADITWGMPANAGSYILQYKTSDLDWSDNGVVTDYPSDTTYSFANPLLPATQYNVRVANICTGGDTSFYRSATFKTACAPVDSLPFVENFDNWGTGSAAYPDCWNKLSTYTSGTTPYINSTSYQGSGSLYFYTASASTYVMAIMPAFDETISLNTLQVSFAYRGTNATDRLVVGVIDDVTDDATFTPIDTVYPSLGNSSAWDERVVTFENYQGTGTHIAFKNEYTSTYCYSYIDNVIVDLISPCTLPTDVIITNYSSDGADIDWTPGANESSWEVVAVAAGTDVNTGTPEPASSHPYTLTGLNANTSYDVYVRSVCDGGENSDWTIKRTFTTNPECSAPLHVTISQITTNSAMVSWDNANFGATSYTVGYSDTIQNSWTTQTVTGNQFMISGLTINTYYNVYVGSNCDAGHADSVTVNFNTRSCLVGGDLEIGDGTNYINYFPTNSCYNYSYSQQIFLASEMNGPGAINSVAFDAQSIVSSNRHVAIYMMHTTAASASSWLPTTNAQLVYNSTTSLSSGWNTLHFSTPFNYNGLDNLAMIIIDSTGSYSCSNQYYYHTTSSSLSRYVYSDGTSYGISTAPSSGTASSYRNNVIFGVPCDSTTTCASPNVYIASVTDNSVTVAWTPGNTETAWELEYHSDIDTDWVAVASATSPYTITNLTDNTTYTVRVRALCGGSETSEWALTYGRTECSVVNTLPLEENFDDAPGSGAGNMVHCWSTITNYSTSYPYTSSTQHNSGNYSAYFYGTSAYFSYLVSPEFDASIALNTLQVRFWAYKTNLNYYIQVGVMTDPNDYSTFTQVGDNLSPDTINNWRFLDINLDQYTGNGHYIALRIPQSYASYMYVDDIAIDLIPNCAHVDSIHVSDVQPNGATVEWVPGGSESAWDVAFVPGTDAVDLDTVNIIAVTGTPSVTVNDLEQNTIYTVYVRANCGAEQSFWMSTEFMTTQVPATLPFLCDFEDSLMVADFAFVNGTQPHQWYVGTATSNGGTHSMYITPDNGATNSYSISTPSVVWAYRDIEFPANPSGYTLSFDWRCYGESGYDYLRVFVGNPVPVTAGNNVQPAGSTAMVPNYNTSNPTYFNLASTYQTFSTTLAGFDETTVKRVYFLWRNDGSAGTMPPASVDNISISAVFCDAPTALTVDSISTTTADISWTTTAASCVLAYRGENDPDWTEVTGVTPPYQLTNLTASTLYMVRVANECEDGVSLSPYVSTSFYTNCDAVTTLPFTEYFDNYTASTSSRPNCWSFPITYSNAPYITANYSSSAPNSLYFQSETTTPTTAVSPQFDADIHTLRARFMLKAESTTSSGTFEVGVMSDPNDVTTFESVRIIQPANTNWNQYTVDFDSTTMTGQGRYIAFRQNSNSNVWYYWMDNLTVMLLPACPEPTGLALVNATTTSVDLTWNSTGSSFNLYYRPITDTAWSVESNVSLTNNAYTITGLTPSTTYAWRVANICNDGSESMSDISNFSTTMEAENLPYSTDFNAGSDVAWMLNNGSCPNYWIIGTADTSSALFITNNGTTPGYATSSSSIVSAEKLFTVGTTSEFIISFDVMSGGDSSWDYLKVFLAPNNAEFPASTTVPDYAATTYTTNAVDFTDYMSSTTGSTSYPYKLNLTNGVLHIETVMPNPNANSDAASTAKLVFVWRNDSSSGTQPGAVIYNVSISAITCPKPTNLTASNLSMNTADLSWTAGGDETSWIVEYKEASATTWNEATVSTTSYQLTGLTSGTNYDVRVSADCIDETSQYATTSFYTPLCPASSTCQYTFVLNDGYGDGWNDGYLTVTQDGTTVAILEAVDHEAGGDGSVDTVFVSLCDNSTTALVWTSGDYDDEAGFTIIGPNGTVLFTHDSMDTYTTFTFTTNCNGSGPVITDPTVATNAASAIQQTTATLNATITNPDNVTVTAKGFEWKATQGGTYTQIAGTGTGNTFTADLTGLTASTGYTFKAFITFNGTTVYGNELTFTTLDESVEPCDVPTNLHTTDIQNESIAIAWDANPNVTGWNIQYKPVGGQLASASSNTNSYTITGLTGLTTYEIQVQAVCANGTSDWSAAITAQTTNVGIENWLENSVALYPNPAKEYVDIRVDGDLNVTMMEVYDVYGKLVNTVDVVENPTRINVSSLANGMYFVRVTTEAGAVTKTFVKK